MSGTRRADAPVSGRGAPSIGGRDSNCLQTSASKSEAQDKLVFDA